MHTTMSPMPKIMVLVSPATLQTKNKLYVPKTKLRNNKLNYSILIMIITPFSLQMEN